jgi:hypothetical protein
MGTVEKSLRPKIRPSKERMADIEAGRTIKRANRLKKMIEKESEGLRDNTPLEPVQQFTLGGDVRHNTNRGKTY